MSENCLFVECVNCSSSVVQSGRLLCNWKNRLGISKEVSAYIGGATDEEVLEKKTASKLEEYEKLKATLETVKTMSGGKQDEG